MNLKFNRTGTLKETSDSLLICRTIKNVSCKAN